MKDFLISVVVMGITISLLVLLYNLAPEDQPWVVFGALGGVAMSLRNR